MPPADVLHALSLTSLAGYLVAWPARRLAPARLPALRFFVVGAPVGGALLLRAGWPPVTSLALALGGAVLAASASALVRRRRAPDPVGPTAAPPSTGPRDTVPSEPPAAAEPALDDTDVAAAPPPADEDPLLDDTDVSAGPPPSHAAASPTSPAPGAGGPSSPTSPAPAAEARPASPTTTPAPGEPDAELWDPRSMSSLPIPAPDVVGHECRRCGTDNGPEARFCKKCSGPLVPWTCERCGERNDVDATFCERCREPLAMLASPLDVEVEDDD